jgi:hypothetical protein
VLIECPEMLVVGSEPLLELGPKLSLSGTVAWMLGDEAGLRFQSPFDLHNLASARPDLAPASWHPPSYLETGSPNESPWNENWDRMSLGELRQQLEGFMKR